MTKSTVYDDAKPGPTFDKGDMVQFAAGTIHSYVVLVTRPVTKGQTVFEGVVISPNSLNEIGTFGTNFTVEMFTKFEGRVELSAQ